MTHPTHTHRGQGGRYLEVSEHAGTGPLEGQRLVIYHDLDRDVMSATTLDDWRQHWRPIAADDCTVCMGTGHDHIKGNKAKPCGGCYGLGKVREDGETPADRWQLADIALGIIQRQQETIDHLDEVLEFPEVKAGIDAHNDRINRQREAAVMESVGRQEQEWRGGAGYGPGGRRQTGD